METAHDIDARVAVPGQLETGGEPESLVSPLTPLDAELYARFFRVLSDQTRVRLLHLLLNGPETGQTVSTLVAAIGAPQSRISTHLGCLRWCGLVHTRREGKQVYYQITDTRVRDLLALGGAMMRDYAAGIASCGVIR
jgi:ArsR family transcriptional regulator